jgi:hypothetical protein
MVNHLVLVVKRLGKFALVWSDDLETICTFDNEFQAYQMRRYLESLQ